jgi:tetratricopeptide (TPR) repeat protein
LASLVITSAYINPKAGLALLVMDGGELLATGPDADDALLPFRTSDIAMYEDAGAFFEPVSSGALSLPNVRTHLKNKTKANQALSFAVSGMDGGLSDKARSLCIKEAEEMLHAPEVKDFLSRHLLGRPTPEVADLGKARRLAEEAKAEYLCWIYSVLDDFRPGLVNLHREWDAQIIAQVPPEKLAEFRAELVNAGITADFIQAAAIPGHHGINRPILVHSRNQVLLSILPALPRLLAAMRNGADRLISPVAIDSPPLLQSMGEMAEDEEADLNVESTIPDRIVELLAEWKQRREFRRAKQGRKSHRNNEDASLPPYDSPGDILANIKNQIGRAEKFMQRSDVEGARRIIFQLIDFQQNNDSKPEYLAKSLCDLATTAQNCRLFELDQELCDGADMLGLTDVVILNTQARSFNKRDEPEKALTAYEQAFKIDPEDVVSRCGYAETLRQLRRFNEAENSYHLSMKIDPLDRVARNGLAGLLLSQGRWNEARPLVICENPTSNADWRDYYLFAMTHAAETDFGTALDMLKHGYENALPENKPYFENAYGAVALRCHDYAKAREALLRSQPVVEFDKFREVRSLLRAHLYAVTNERQQMENSLREVEKSRSLPVVELRQKIAARANFTLRDDATAATEDLDGQIFQIELELLAA